MHPFEKSVADFIDCHNILPDKQKRVLIALSGGADSVALLVVLHSLGYHCKALHCNFHLRGEESNRDCNHALEIARSIGVECEVRGFDVGDYRKNHGGSIEMACRDLRYTWFAEKIDNDDAQAIAVGHNISDNVETFFLNLLRGTSLAGLTGMEPIDHARKIARPLLASSRAEILSYLAYKSISYVDDSTNFENVYRRNRLRNVILPQIYELFPGSEANIISTINLLRQNNNLYRSAIDYAFESIKTSAGEIDLNALVEMPQADLILYEALKSQGITATQARQILTSRGESGRVFTSSRATFIIDRGHLRAINPLSITSAAPDSIDIAIIPASEIDYSRCPACAYFSMEMEQHLPNLTIRSWQSGDRIKPWGMKGSKLVSDIFSDAKMAIDRKMTIPIVELDGNILWVGGLRNSRHFPVGKGDEKAIRLSLR